MKFEASNCQYIIKIKLTDIYTTEDEYPQEVKDKIIEKGRKQLREYFLGNLFDPEKKIIFEDTSFKLKKI